MSPRLYCRYAAQSQRNFRRVRLCHWLKCAQDATLRHNTTMPRWIWVELKSSTENGSAESEKLFIIYYVRRFRASSKAWGYRHASSRTSRQKWHEASSQVKAIEVSGKEIAAKQRRGSARSAINILAPVNAWWEVGRDFQDLGPDAHKDRSHTDFVSNISTAKAETYDSRSAIGHTFTVSVPLSNGPICLKRLLVVKQERSI